MNVIFLGLVVRKQWQIFQDVRVSEQVTSRAVNEISLKIQNTQAKTWG